MRAKLALLARAGAEGVAGCAAVLVVVVALWIFFSIQYPRFLTGPNVENLLTGVSILWIVSMGMTFVVLTAGIDLSVGAMLALSGVFLERLLSAGLPDWVGVPLTVAGAALLGMAVNGSLIGGIGLSFFVVTLGSTALLVGAVNIWTGTKTSYIDSQLVENIGIGRVAHLPIPIWMMIGSFVLAYYVLRFTFFGRDVYAVGGNRAAARLAGVNVSRTLMVVYAISAGSAGLATLIQVGRLGAASPLVGSDIPLLAAAAVLLGGTSFVGGIGGVVGTAVGVIFIGTLSNGLGIAGVSSYWQQVITGAILITAVFVDWARMNKNLFRGRRTRRDSHATP